ncbi:membrane protein [Mycobacterium phage Curiosium]|uniref:Membrane protein n=1 Tax=Mycobacterium phage Curiosium TaxID=2599859 RepID=A0A5J6TTD9_9CAUD|nr:membrane protein [Mycobacterium phage Curiosium]QFG14090.1 membrane protein [Mycobacterium phage Curiosium]
MTTAAYLALTAALIARRKTWRARYEAAASLTLAFAGIGFLLQGRTATQTLGQGLHCIFGVRHLDDFLGHLCWIGAAVALAYYVLQRLAPTEAISGLLNMWVHPVLTVAVPVMFALLILHEQASGADELATLATAAHTPWLVAYRVVFALVLTYLLGLCLRLLHHLSGQVHGVTRALVCMYVFAGVLAAAAALVPVPHLLLSDHTHGTIGQHGHTWELVIAPGLMAASAIVTSFATTFSWWLKMRPYSGLLRKTRTQRRERQRDTLQSHRDRLQPGGDLQLGSDPVAS